MQIRLTPQFLPIVGSHSLPRLVDEPHTLYVPDAVTTPLQMLN